MYFCELEPLVPPPLTPACNMAAGRQPTSVCCASVALALLSCAGLLGYAQRYIAVGMAADFSVSQSPPSAHSTMLQVGCTLRDLHHMAFGRVK